MTLWVLFLTLYQLYYTLNKKSIEMEKLTFTEKKPLIFYPKLNLNSRPYIFSAAIPAGNIASALQALRILIKEPNRVSDLSHIADYMRKALVKRGVEIRESSTPIIPIYTYTPLRTMVACNMLFEHGVYVNPVVPPATPVGECLIRTSYTSTHTKAQMDEAADKIAEVLELLKDMNE